jgi:hypothetical protein
MRWSLRGLMKKPIDGKVYIVPEENKPLRTGEPAGKNKPLPKEFIDRMFKPGRSGNPGGRTKGMSDQVKKFLTRKVPKDPEGRIYLEKLVEAMVKRAIKKSDVLVKEIFDRVEGKVPNDPARGRSVRSENNHCRHSRAAWRIQSVHRCRAAKASEELRKLRRQWEQAEGMRWTPRHRILRSA